MLDAPTPLFQLDIDVIFRDVDALGHVNNAVYFTYMETARTRYFMEALNLSSPNELPFIVAQTQCDYRSPARFGDKLLVEILLSRIGTKSFNLIYLIKTSENQMIAEGKTVMVTFDYQTKSSVPIPPKLRRLLQNNTP